MEDSRQDLRTEHSARRTRKSKCKMQISKCRMPRSGICHEDRSNEETVFAKTRMMWPCRTEARRRRRVWQDLTLHQRGRRSEDGGFTSGPVDGGREKE